MKKYISILLALLITLSLLAGCGKDSITDGTNNGNATTPTDNTKPADADFSKTDSDMYTERDGKTEYDESKAVTIQLNGTTATASSDSVKISGSTVQITEEATYVISGELTDGMLIVNAPDTAKLQIVLNGANITSKTSAALYILEADKVFVTLAEGANNALVNGGSFTAIDDNNIDGALFSKQDLTLNGAGSLTVTSPAGHDIVCKDDLVITGGTYGTSFALNRKFYSQNFRNAMAHYKVGVYLKKHEILSNDPMFGMTQKAFGTDFYQTKNEVMGELSALANQLEKYLGV